MILTTAQIKALYALKDADVAFVLAPFGDGSVVVTTTEADRRWMINEAGATVKLLSDAERMAL